jgi:PAS domain S-box-containing protein
MEIVYNPYLILLSVAVAIMASYAALNLAYSITQAFGKTQLAWLFGGSLAMGTGIWSMHFIGMQAFEMPNMEMGYDIRLMTLSVIVAIIGSLLALYVVSRPTVHSKSIIWGGFSMAAAISGMHYIGMYSMRLPARLEWNYFLVALSIAIAVVASCGALTIAARLRNEPDRFITLLFASTIMGSAISGMHYTGMLAATFVHDQSALVKESDLLMTSSLTMATVSTTLLVLGIALGGSIGQRVLASRQKKSENIIVSNEEKYRVLVEAIKDYAIFMLDPQGFITTWNRGAEHITGYSLQDIVGKHVSTLYTKEGSPSEIADVELSTVIRTGHFEGEALRKKKDGSTFWANIILDPLLDEEGKLTGFSKVIRDVTEFKNVTERNRFANEELEKRVQERTLALQERESQLRIITNSMPVMVAQLDKNERFLFANNFFCDWFQRSHDEIMKENFRTLLGEDRYPDNKTYIDKALAGETVNFEKNSHSGTRQSILNITLIPALNSNNEANGFIVLAADVSNYKRIEDELKTAKIEAEVANETKSAFLANMSHEIRTPLGAVIGFSELLAEDNISPAERAHTIEIIKRNGRLVSTIINDILDLSKVEAGKMEIERVSINLMETVNDIAALLNLEATGKGIQLNVYSDPLIPKSIKTDPTRLRQILFNVVGNAIKFTQKGSVNVKIGRGSDPTQIEFTIQDTGTGIAAEQAKRLFSPFTQADVTTTRKFGGTGLGLVLSKKLANALGGDAQLTQSQLGTGSTFIITIEHGQSDDKFLANAQTDENRPAKVQTPRNFDKVGELTGQTILVVDDSPDNLALVKWILKMAGANVVTANNGREGIEKAISENVSTVLMDLQMPGMDGYEATRELRKQGFIRPIIALTAHAMKEERKRCLESGFNEHITKPIDKKNLIQLLSELPS